MCHGPWELSTGLAENSCMSKQEKLPEWSKSPNVVPCQVRVAHIRLANSLIEPNGWIVQWLINAQLIKWGSLVLGDDLLWVGLLCLISLTIRNVSNCCVMLVCQVWNKCLITLFSSFWIYLMKNIQRLPHELLKRTLPFPNYLTVWNRILLMWHK